MLDLTYLDPAVDVEVRPEIAEHCGHPHADPRHGGQFVEDHRRQGKRHGGESERQNNAPEEKIRDGARIEKAGLNETTAQLTLIAAVG